jgi:hypothetical protein
MTSSERRFGADFVLVSFPHTCSLMKERLRKELARLRNTKDRVEE